MSTESKYEQDMVAKLTRALVGKKVADVFYMPKDETGHNGWYKRPIVIVLDDGNCLYPMADDEGNDGGALATTVEGCETVGVIR